MLELNGSLSPRCKRSLRCCLFVASLWSLISGCIPPSYSPITRQGTGSMPEPTGGEGRAIAQIAFGIPPASVTVEPRLQLGVSRRVDLDFNLMMLGIYRADIDMVMGSAAVHYRAVQHRIFKLSFGGGLAGGYGGRWRRRLPDNPDTGDDRWETGTPNTAIGGLLSFDYGFRLHRVFGIYLGNTFHVSWADPAPVTVWGHHTFGLQFDWTRRLFSTVETGFWWYENMDERRSYSSIFYATLIGYRFGVK